MSAVFTDIVTVADVRTAADARHGLALYGLLKLRRATDRRIAELDRREEHQLAAPGALSDEARDAIDVLCAAVKEVTELRAGLEQEIHRVCGARRLGRRTRWR